MGYMMEIAPSLYDIFSSQILVTAKLLNYLNDEEKMQAFLLVTRMFDQKCSTLVKTKSSAESEEDKDTYQNTVNSFTFDNDVTDKIKFSVVVEGKPVGEVLCDDNELLKVQINEDYLKQQEIDENVENEEANYSVDEEETI